VLDLVAVMPVYNEEDGVESAVGACVAALAATGGAFHAMVLDDGSTDRTPEVLERLAGDPRVEVIRKRNTGHGPTILEGYRRVAGRARWVFQLDSDHEIPISSFAALWAARKEADAVVGVRTRRRQSLPRRLVTRASRIAVRVLFGCAVTDVNCPFRLIRGDVLARLVDRIPPDTFAPNVALSGLLARERRPVANVPVPVVERDSKTASLAGWRAVATGLQALHQTVAIRRRHG
jgi:glycosyltransferase involved in cell wall biosynthesis